MEPINKNIILINKGLASTIRVCDELCSCHIQQREEESSNYQYSVAPVAEKENVKNENDDDVDEPGDEVAGNDDVACNQRGENNKVGEDSSCNSFTASIVNKTCYEVGDARSAEAGLGKEEGMPKVMIQLINKRSIRDIVNEISVGSMKSISNQDLYRPSIILNAVLDQAQFKGLRMCLNQDIMEWHKEKVQAEF
ncbi:hypothetical protein LOK49_LG02G00546 [Camellia lanceoleosa]|uniref:Uncharacterized protein n=1 Tax=Camellia lanceoleosa TaxID=1840588 RepID=A0ACC0IPW9_9ERIC|nr:hypothetical protein LOK49_LG02G00546 [Camellia lanceoleosa]